MGVARSGGRRFGSWFRCPSAGSAQVGPDWALGVRAAEAVCSLTPCAEAPDAEAAAAQADNELGARRDLAGLGPAPLGQASSLQARSPVGGVPFAARSQPCSRCPARLGTLREGPPVAAPGLTRPLPRQNECGPSSKTEDRVPAWWRCGQLEGGGGRTPRGTHRLAVPQNRPKESEFARPWVGQELRGKDEI